MIQAASFLFKESEETWNFRRVLRPVDVEGGSLKVPYIEDEIWGSSPHTQFKEGISSKITLAQFPREPSTSKSMPLHKGAIEYTFRIPKRSTLSQKKKTLMTMHLVRRNVRSMPWVAKETLAPIGKQDSTSHNLGPRTSKSSSSSKESGSMILRGYCGARRS